jgi:crotonobetaine/carnitine-CoA ligase
MDSHYAHIDAGPPWSGCDAATIVDILRRAAECQPEDPALIFEDGLTVTRVALHRRVEAFAGYLRERVVPGDHVAILLASRTEFMVALFAVVAVRAALVSIPISAGEHDAGHILRDSKSVLAIVGAERRDLIAGLQSSCPALREIVEVSVSEPDGLARYQGRATLPLFRAACVPEDVTAVYYTSGTTGPPKGCMVDHVWWRRIVDVEQRINRKCRDDRSLCCLPFHYNDAPIMLLTSLNSGGAMVVMRHFSVSRFWNVVRTHDVTQFLSLGPMPALLLKAPPAQSDRDHRMRRAHGVGVPMGEHRKLVERFGFHWIDSYATSESGFITRVPMHLADEFIGSGSVGVAVPEVEVRLINDADKDVPDGEVGQFVVRAPGMFRGYLGNPLATAESMRDGWYSTGDMGRRDGNGLYYFVGRKKDIIRRSGENISASEVEEVLRSHPKILEAAVIPVPDPLRGEEVKAYLLPVKGESMSTISPEELVAYCAAKLASFKVPRYFEFRATDFPRTPTMRVRKELLRLERADLISGSWDKEVSRIV